MVKKILYSLVIIICITTLAIVIIAYGRGYRINPWEKSLDPTGILSATSFPDGASIFINDKLTSATNGSISLAPGWYNLRISKVGYQSWEKRIRVQGEVVTRVDALLIPNNPSLRALTVSGIANPTLSPSGTRVAYIVPEDEATPSAVAQPRTGIWVFDLRNGPLGGIADPKQVYKSGQNWNPKNSQIFWSPDEKNLILATKNRVGNKEVIGMALQIWLDNPTISPMPVTSTLDSIFSDWENLRGEKLDQSINALPASVSGFLKKGASNIGFSPDSSKILYLATASATLPPIITPPLIGTNPTEEERTTKPGKYYVYDIKEDKNFAIIGEKTTPTIPIWYTDSKRIVMIENSTIVIIDYDGTNKRTVYSGPFIGNIVYPWTQPGKLVILTNLNKPQALPNLYEVDIR